MNKTKIIGHSVHKYLFVLSMILVSLPIFSFSALNSFSLSDTNYGVEIGMNINKTGNRIINKGDYCALKCLFIEATSFEGNGCIYANSIIINCKKFVFTGTISCNKCIINAEEHFDETIFKRHGSGDFIINIGKDHAQTRANIIQKESISLEPLKSLCMQFPRNHPIKTFAYSALAMTGLIIYVSTYLNK